MRGQEGGAMSGRQEMMMRQPAGATRQREANDEMMRRREGGASRGDATMDEGGHSHLTVVMNGSCGSG